MTPRTPAGSPSPIWKKYMTITRDVVFVILFLVSVGGWIRTATIQKTRLEDEVKTLTVAMEEITDQLEKINDILMDQKELNGKIIQYMQQK